MDKVIHFIRQFKVSFIFVVLSIILFSISFFISSRNTNSSDIIFTTHESSSSANLVTGITVNIEGAVNVPGVYTLDSRSRVNDLIEKAGGLTTAADEQWVGRYINKAQVLNDGDKLYIPTIEDNKNNQNTTNSIQSSFTQTGVKVNVNLASQSELETLPGIGEKTAVKIIESRPYGEITDLREKKIVGDSVFGKIQDLISVL